MFLILSLLACDPKADPDAHALVGTLELSPVDEAVAWNQPMHVTVSARGPQETAPALSLVWESGSGTQLAADVAVQMSPWVAATDDTGLEALFEHSWSWGIELPAEISPGSWSLVLLNDDDEGAELDRVDFEVGDWGFVEEDPGALLPLAQPLLAPMSFADPRGFEAILAIAAEAQPVLELASLEGDQLTWRLMMYDPAWLEEGDVPACRMLEGSATLEADGRFTGLEPEVVNTMSGGEQFLLFDQRLQGSVNADGELGVVLVSGAVDMSLFDSWTEGETCALAQGFGITCDPCPGHPELSCLDATLQLQDLEPLEGLPAYEELPWCSAAADDIPSLDFDFDANCSGCAAGGRGGLGWMGLGLALVALRRRRR